MEQYNTIEENNIESVDHFPAPTDSRNHKVDSASINIGMNMAKAFEKNHRPSVGRPNLSSVNKEGGGSSIRPVASKNIP